MSGRYVPRPNNFIVDDFVHIDDPDEPFEQLLSELRQVGVQACVFSESNFCDGLGVATQNPLGMWLKHRYPASVYFFASSDYLFLAQKSNLKEPERTPPDELVRRYVALGADGWKSVSGKPERYRIPLSAPELDPLYDALQSARVPLFWHVGDPEEFWDPETLPRWALKQWAYGPEHPTLETLRSQAMEVLDRYPHLRVIFAHFFFIAPQLDRAAQLLERYPNVYLDLTPGIEMYFAFTRQRQRAREFFCQYSDRILLGSYSSFTRSPIPVITMIRRFLETEDTFDPPHTDPYMWPDDRAPIQGLGLSMEVVDRIYWSNPLELLGRKPRPLQEKAARDEIRRLAAIEGSHGLARTVLRRWDSQ